METWRKPGKDGPDYRLGKEVKDKQSKKSKGKEEHKENTRWGEVREYTFIVMSRHLSKSL